MLTSGYSITVKPLWADEGHSIHTHNIHPSRILSQLFLPLREMLSFRNFTDHLTLSWERSSLNIGLYFQITYAFW